MILYSQKLARLTKTNRSGRFFDFRFFVKNRDRILREPIFEDFDHEIAISYFLVLCTRKFIKFCAFHVPELCRQRQFILTNELVENRFVKKRKIKGFSSTHRIFEICESKIMISKKSKRQAKNSMKFYATYVVEMFDQIHVIPFIQPFQNRHQNLKNQFSKNQHRL